MAALAFSFATKLFAAEDPEPPCKTPKELLKCVERALVTQNTNLFWRLHCLTNVTTQTEQIRRLCMSPHFPTDPDDVTSFSSFRILKPRPDHSEVLTRKDGGQVKQNLQIEGWITFTQTIKSRDRKSRSTIAGDLPFGKGTDGNYWLSMMILVPATKTNSVPAK